MQLAMDNRSRMSRLRREEVPSSVQLWRGVESRDASSMPATTAVAFEAFFSSLQGSAIEPANLPCDGALSPSLPAPCSLWGPLTRRVELFRNGWQPRADLPLSVAARSLRPRGERACGFHTPPAPKS